MNLPEQGISGPFTVKSIKHALPQKIPNQEDTENYLDGNFAVRPITGIFVHHSDQVLQLKFENGDSLGVTKNHPIYSNSSQKWQLASDLMIGEEVLTYHGSNKLVSKVQLAGAHQVYNLEVKDLHNFLVGDVGVVVHNTGNCWNLLKDIFKIFGFNFNDAKKLSGKKWAHALDNDVPLTKEVEFTEEIGEHIQKRIALAPKGAAGFDAISEQGKVLTYKVMESQSAATNLTNLETNISSAISSYKKLQQSTDYKVDIWVKGNFATKEQAYAQWLLIKEPNVNYSSHLDVIGKIFYKGPNGIIELD